jgi:cysteine desulfurase family protein (TIGR01976 family)
MQTEAGTVDLSAARRQFPALARSVGGAPAVYADAPGGTQVPSSVIDAVSRYLADRNANTGGAFVTSEATDETIAEARRAGADLLGCSADEIVFGANMTSLAFALSRSITRLLRPGDNVVVTALDHDANVMPWVEAARDACAEVRWADLDPVTGTLDLDSLDGALNRRTRVVAFTLASNALGTVPPADDIVARIEAKATEALIICDGVHLAPHRAMHAAALGADVVLCSAYKFFGPHVSVMFLRRAVADGLHAYKVRPAHDEHPDRWENGTKNHEGLAGFTAAIDYIAGLAAPPGSNEPSGRRGRVLASMHAVERFEAELATRFIEGLERIGNARLYGLAAGQVDARTPTFAVTMANHQPRAVAARLGDRGVFVWDGNYYALAAMERLGLEPHGGAVRVGFCHYNTAEEVDRVLEELDRVARS